MHREDRTAARRAHIMQAALECFVRKGFHQSSMRDIAAEAGVSLGNLYNHFAGKDALIREIARMEADLWQPVLYGLQTDPAERILPRFVRAYLALCSPRESVILTADILAEVVRDPEMARAFADNRRQLVSGLVAALARMAGAACLREGLVPDRALAEMVLDTIEGHAVRNAVFGDPVPDDRLFALLEGLLAPWPARTA